LANIGYISEFKYYPFINDKKKSDFREKFI